MGGWMVTVMTRQKRQKQWGNVQKMVSNRLLKKLWRGLIILLKVCGSRGTAFEPRIRRVFFNSLLTEVILLAKEEQLFFPRGHFPGFAERAFVIVSQQMKNAVYEQEGKFFP